MCVCVLNFVAGVFSAGTRKNDVKSIRMPFSQEFYAKLCNFVNYSINVKGTHHRMIPFSLVSSSLRINTTEVKLNEEVNSELIDAVAGKCLRFPVCSETKELQKNRETKPKRHSRRDKNR